MKDAFCPHSQTLKFPLTPRHSCCHTPAVKHNWVLNWRHCTNMFIWVQDSKEHSLTSFPELSDCMNFLHCSRTECWRSRRVQSGRSSDSLCPRDRVDISAHEIQNMIRDELGHYIQPISVILFLIKIWSTQNIFPVNTFVLTECSLSCLGLGFND